MATQFRCGNCPQHCVLPQWTLDQYRAIVDGTKSFNTATMITCKKLLVGDRGALYCHKDDKNIICNVVIVNYTSKMEDKKLLSTS